MFKKDLDFDIIHIGEVDDSAVKNELLKILKENEEMSINNDRHNFRSHSKTKTHLIYAFPLEWDGVSELDAELFTDDKAIIDAVEPLVRMLEERYNGKRGRVLIINLPSGKDIPEHTDSGPYLQIVHRTHIPIITNDQVVFGVGETEMNMKEGNCYEINNHKIHYVYNNGESDRYHLLIDIIPFKKPTHLVIPFPDNIN